MASTEQPGPEQLAELRILARATVQAERAQLERRAARARSQLAKIEERLAQPADDAVTAQLERMKDRIQNHRSGRRPHGRRPGGGRGRGRGEGGRRKKEQGDKK